jgi:uncharacterized membrane protein
MSHSIKRISVLMLVGVALVLPHLFDAIWQDEAYTLLGFASRGFLYPFTDYHLPNNHVLLSAMLSLWWSPGESVIALRLPFLLAFIASMALLVSIARKIAGETVALLAIIFFSFGTVASNFTLQLRGYGISWLFVTLMVWALLAWVHYNQARFGFIYGLSGAILLAIVPTNLLTCLVIMGWGAVLICQQSIAPRDKMLRLLALCGLPLLGLSAYIAIWPQVLAASGKAFSDWTKTGAYAEFYLSYLSDFIVVLPIVLLGLITGRKFESNDYRPGWLMASVILVPVVFLAVLKNPPFPRNFVPLIPLISLSLAVFTEKGLNVLQARKWIQPLPAVALIAVLVLAMKFAAWDCRKIAKLDSVSNICSTYYQHDYRPESVAAFLASRTDNASGLVLADFEGLFALMFLNANLGLGLNLDHYKTYQPENNSELPWIVLGGDPATSLVIKMNAKEVLYKVKFDSGYFKVYIPAQ